MHYAFYCFGDVEDMSLVELYFDSSADYPKTLMSCSGCGQNVGFVQPSSLNDKRNYYVISKSVYLEINGARCSLESHSEHLP